MSESNPRSPLRPNTSPVTPSHPSGLLIGGEWRPAVDGRTFDVENPATGEVISTVADATVTDALAAMTSAGEATTAMAAMPPGRRATALREIEAEIRRRTDEFALLITLEMGKPLVEARAEIGYAADFFGWYADEARRISGDFRTSPQGNTRILVHRRGVGPCLLVTPWNFPLAMGARKIAPAIAAGCPSVLKPAEQTPLTSLLLAEVIEAVGLPSGAINIITTSRPAEVVSAMIETGVARKLSFTGSTSVGKLLLAQCAPHVMRTSMELGGNAPFLVFDDADVDAAVDGAIVAKMRNMGEACTAANRFFVAEPVAEEFTRKLAERMGAMQVGAGWLDTTDVGPLIDNQAVAKFARLVEDAVERGGSIEVGGAAIDGRFVRPTVISNVPAGSQVLDEEIFGPLAPVMTFADEGEALQRANATRHGLISYVYTRDVARAFRMVGSLGSGMVGVNVGVVSNAAAPFGGIKESGLGREGGFEGLDEYLDTIYAAVAF